MGQKPKQFTRPPAKKKPAKAAALVTADDYQEAADFEEAAGGKHRAGDPVKSARAFLRAFELYDTGVGKHPKDFDLAYNKARLELEISQQPAILEHIGVELPVWLERALVSHRHALSLNEENPDVLFNIAQVEASLAEQLTEDDRDDEAIVFLEQALNHLSTCLARQELMYEQHKLDFPDTDDGGVALEQTEQQSQPTAAGASSGDAEMTEQQSAIVETPISPSDLLDTVHASLSALTTLAPLLDEKGLQNLGDMARQLIETKAPSYINLLPIEGQDKARIATAVSRASFIASYASAQFEHHMIELQAYVERLDAFDIPGKDCDADALVAEAEARTELVMSTIDRFGEAPMIPASLCWRELSTSQDLYSKATKLTTESAQESRAEVYKSKGDLELLRHRLIYIPKTDLSDSIRSSAQTLIQNARTYYKGAMNLAKAAGDEEVETEAEQRLKIAKGIAALMYSGESPAPDTELSEALESCVEEGIISQQLADALFSQDTSSAS